MTMFDPPGRDLEAPPLGATPEPWPYAPYEGPASLTPTWTCPEGLCACHPVVEDDVQREDHVIVLYDPQAKRMPLARCRVFEQGKLITPEPTSADAAGEVRVQLRASTSTLRVEWAPAELPNDRFLPYRRLYHLEMPADRSLAAERRLTHIGFSRRRSREENVADYERAYGREPTGDIRAIELEVLERHDDGTLPVFHPQEPAGSPAEPSPHARSFLGSPARVAPERTEGDGDGDGDGTSKKRVAPSTGAPQTAAPSGGSATGSKTTQGSVVPDAAHVAIMVALEPNAPLNPADVTVRLRPRNVPGMTPEQREVLVKPTGDAPGSPWPGSPAHLVFAFRNVPVGTYDALATVDRVTSPTTVGPTSFAMGSTPLDVKMGLLTLGYVAAIVDRPILNVDDPLLDMDHPMIQRRRKVLATVYKYFPQSADTMAAAKGIYPPYNQGKYKPMAVGDATNSCTPVNTNIMQLASGVGHIYGENLKERHPAFVRYQHGRVPSVGDSVYLQYVSGKKKEQFAHVGLVVRSTLEPSDRDDLADTWLTADGGQIDRTEFRNDNDGKGWRRHYDPPPSREGAFVVARAYAQGTDGSGLLGNEFMYPIAGSGGAYGIVGWGNLTDSRTPFKTPGFDEDEKTGHGSTSDYRAMKELVSALPNKVKLEREARYDEAGLPLPTKKPPPGAR